MKVLGIYVTDTQIRICQYSDADRQPAVKEYPVFTRTLKKEEIPPALKNIIKTHNFQPDRVVLYIPRLWVSVRFMNIPAVENNEIEKIVAYERGSNVPFKADELVFSHAVVSKSNSGYSKVFLAAVQKERLTPVLGLLKSAGFIPDEIAVSVVSVYNQVIAAKGAKESLLWVNEDDGFADVLFIENGSLSFSRAIASNAGPDNFEKELSRTVQTLREQGNRINLDDIVRNNRVSVVQGVSLLGRTDSLVADLLPRELKERKLQDLHKRALVYFVTLIALNLAIAANILFMRVKAQDTYVHMLKSEMGKIESRAQSIQKKMRKAQILIEYSASGKIVLGLLSELYTAAPSDVVLSSLDISGKSPKGIIVLVGQASGSDTVLKFANAMKTGGFIKKTDVSYITKRPGSAGQSVDFEIKAVF